MRGKLAPIPKYPYLLFVTKRESDEKLIWTQKRFVVGITGTVILCKKLVNQTFTPKKLLVGAGAYLTMELRDL